MSISVTVRSGTPTKTVVRMMLFSSLDSSITQSQSAVTVRVVWFPILSGIQLNVTFLASLTFSDSIDTLSVTFPSAVRLTLKP